MERKEAIQKAVTAALGFDLPPHELAVFERALAEHGFAVVDMARMQALLKQHGIEEPTWLTSI